MTTSLPSSSRDGGFSTTTDWVATRSAGPDGRADITPLLVAEELHHINPDQQIDRQPRCCTFEAICKDLSLGCLCALDVQRAAWHVIGVTHLCGCCGGCITELMLTGVTWLQTAHLTQDAPCAYMRVIWQHAQTRCPMSFACDLQPSSSHTHSNARAQVAAMTPRSDRQKPHIYLPDLLR